MSVGSGGTPTDGAMKKDMDMLLYPGVILLTTGTVMSIFCSVKKKMHFYIIWKKIIVRNVVFFV